jgi:hypothetical protein
VPLRILRGLRCVVSSRRLHRHLLEVRRMSMNEIEPGDTIILDEIEKAMHAYMDGHDYIVGGVRFKPVSKQEYYALLEAGVRVSSWFELPSVSDPRDSRWFYANCWDDGKYGSRWFYANCWDDGKYGKADTALHFFAAVDGA